jgi:hypothetical protein
MVNINASICNTFSHIMILGIYRSSVILRPPALPITLRARPFTGMVVVVLQCKRVWMESKITM